MSETTTKKRKASLPILIAGGVSSLVLALGMSPTFSAFTASITNSVNNVSTGTLIMTESTTIGGTTTTCKSTDGGSILTNAATCATINKYGGSVLAPGGTDTVTVNIKNDGTLTPAAFTLAPTTVCTQSGGVTGSPSDFCKKLTLTISQDGVQKWNGTLDTFLTTTTVPLVTVAPTTSSVITFKVVVDSTLTNPYQGLSAAQQLVWKFQA